MLVFGVGQDSKLWMLANKKGDTYFLENSVYGLAQIKTEIPEINAQIIKYITVRKDWKELLFSPHNNPVFTHYFSHHQQIFNRNNLVALVSQQQVRHRQRIFFAITNNSVQIVVFPVNTGNLAAINIVFWCWDVKKFAK